MPPKENRDSSQRSAASPGSDLPRTRSSGRSITGRRPGTQPARACSNLKSRWSFRPPYLRRRDGMYGRFLPPYPKRRSHRSGQSSGTVTCPGGGARDRLGRHFQCSRCLQYRPERGTGRSSSPGNSPYPGGARPLCPGGTVPAEETVAHRQRRTGGLPNPFSFHHRKEGRSCSQIGSPPNPACLDGISGGKRSPIPPNQFNSW